VLILKKYLALPAPDKSTISQLVSHFCATGSVATKKNWTFVTANKKILKMLFSIYCSHPEKNQWAELHYKVVCLIEAHKVRPKSLL
jgi:hypothetical protein